MRGFGEVLLVSCYELGHQPVALATASAYLERAGYRPACIDLAVERLDEERLRQARLVGISTPMHTALRLGVRAAERIRAANPTAHICFYGLYATLNADHLLGGIADSVIGGEFEAPLLSLAEALSAGERPDRAVAPHLEKVSFPVPQRQGLPPLSRYAMLEADGTTRAAAAVEASRGCLHLCRHCPIPPVYGGRFFVVPKTIVTEDIARVVGAGATHITFADPDFLNGPRHSTAIVRSLHEAFPRVTFDFTTKVEHILKHREIFAEMAACGCLFVVSAVESLSDVVLDHLRKGHSRRDVFLALEVLRSAGIILRPSFVPFTPWSTLRDYEDLLDWIDDESLIDQVDAVQLSIRLLVPPGSLLVDHPAMRPHLGRLQPGNFSFAWTHPDPRMDRLQVQVSSVVHDAAAANEAAERTFERIRAVADAASGAVPEARVRKFLPAREHARPPRLTEPWFC